MKRKIIIIGGGASGIACALRLKSNNPKIDCLILEQNPRIGKKILKTGNGRCNISNLGVSPANYNQPEFVSECLKRFSVNDLVSFFQRFGLLLRSDEAGRLYPYSDYANTVVDVLLHSIKNLGLEVLCDQRVKKVRKNNGFEVSTDVSTFQSDILVFSTGSLAQERTNGYEILRDLGHTVTDLEPGLVPLKTKENLSSLKGIKVKCRARLLSRGKVMMEEDGEILFKERGLSGILSMNLSRRAQAGDVVSLDLFPQTDILPFLKNASEEKGPEEALLGMLPKMLAFEVLRRNPDRDMNGIHATLKDLRFHVEGKYGFDAAQITLGGVAIEEINPDFSSKKDGDLYVVGEVLDVDGECGGFNLHFAWMSGILAADAISERFEKNL